MIALILAAIAGLAALPADIAGRQTPAAYNALLERNVLENHRRMQALPCPRAMLQSQGRNRWRGNDVPPETARESVTGDVIVEHVMVTGCGRPQRHNMLVYRQRSGELAIIPLPTGVSLTSPTLQRDAFSAAVRIATGFTDESLCPRGSSLADRFRFGDVSIERNRVGMGAWSERMPIQYCGQNRTVVVTFTPSARGGTDWDIRPVWPGAPQRR